MPRALGRRQQEGLRQIVANGGANLRNVIATAQRNSRATGNNVVRELQTLAARGNSSARTVVTALGGGGASTGGSGG